MKEQDLFILNSRTVERNPRILVVDDNHAIHEDFKKIFRSNDSNLINSLESQLFGETKPAQRPSFEIDFASQGSDALEMVKQAMEKGRPYAMAFIDVRMPPGWDGIETAKEIWKVYADLQIVICSAYSDYSWDETVSVLGNSDQLLILKKPFDNIEVLQLANALTEKWRLIQQSRAKVEDLESMVALRTHELQLALKEVQTSFAEAERMLTERIEAEKRVSAFSALGRKLSSAQTAREAGDIIIDVADDLFGLDACTLYLYSLKEDKMFNVLNADTMDGKRISVPPLYHDAAPNERARLIIEKGKQLILREPSDSTWFGVPFGDKARRSASLMFVPIYDGSNVIGVFSIQSYTHYAYTQQDLDVFQALANHCGGALNRIRGEEDRKQLEEEYRQLQKMEAIGQLAGGIAHDFNNLLTIINGYSDLLLTSYDSTSQQGELLMEIYAAGERAAQLTRQLLTFSRKQAVRPQTLYVNRVVNDMAKMLRRLIGENIALNVHNAPGLPPVLADLGMIEQTVLNLAINARDAMPDSGQLSIFTREITIDEAHVQRHPEARPGNFVCLAVQDTGCGMSPEVLARIFEPFFTTKAVGKGTGLGLATVFGIVKQHQGWIEVSSTVGKGTIFKVLFPVTTPSVNPIREQPPRDLIADGSETILLVEDEQCVRNLAMLALEKYGYRVLEAESGIEALEVWARHSSRIDLLLTDMVMPGDMSGRELALRLLAEKPELKVIYTSGYCADTAGEVFGLGRQTLLQKPYHPRKLANTVRQALNNAKEEIVRDAEHPHQQTNPHIFS